MPYPYKNATLTLLRDVPMNQEEEKWCSKWGEAAPLCASRSKKQRHSWKEHMGQPQVCRFLNHPKGWNIWKTNRNAVMQLGNAKKKRISQLHLLLYSCQVSSLAICELHNCMQHLCDSSCSQSYQMFVNYISIECWWVLVIRRKGKQSKRELKCLKIY